MRHIAVDRNRKKMNEHLRVLKSLMSGSYRDQASIIGGIEFVRELEQLLQCLESQKRLRILREPGIALREETAENKSCLADVDVKLLEFDAMIKKLSRRRPGQLIKTIASLEDLHLSILHTYMTTMEQTVLYSFNVKTRKVDVEGFLSAQAATDAIKGSMDLYAMNIPVESVPPDSRFYVEIRTDSVNTENEWNRRAGSLTPPSL
ncbi:hypothetical protein DY000_02060695 [Brassica cretica]|uniref:BHLH domain-containing protein n=1 Tax=Brassica cretica TaxID=69181 RepID=A0ABQ7B172_BRACR|nr:hypothetical protein DY000_02060695 [Brassica cretica]